MYLDGLAFFTRWLSTTSKSLHKLFLQVFENQTPGFAPTTLTIGRHPWMLSNLLVGEVLHFANDLFFSLKNAYLKLPFLYWGRGY